jgi:hypothetical protein
MNNEYDAEALAWQLVIKGQPRAILTSCALDPGTRFSVEGMLSGPCFVYVVEIVDKVFTSLLCARTSLGEYMSIPGFGDTLTTDLCGYVRVVAAPRPVPTEAWPVLVSALFCTEESGTERPDPTGTWSELGPTLLPDCCAGPPSPGNSDTM